MARTDSKRISKAQVQEHSGDSPREHSVRTQAASRSGLSEAQRKSVQRWLEEQFLGDEFARLGQGGHTEDQLPLRRVFVDLPMSEQLLVEPSSGGGVRYFLAEFMQATPIEPGTRAMDLDELEAPSPRPLHQPAAGRQSCGAAVVLIGGPGQGKSTLGQLACQLHRAALLSPHEAEVQQRTRDLLQTFRAMTRPRARGAKRTSPEQELRLPQEPLLPLKVVLPDASRWLARNLTASDEDTRETALLRFLVAQPSAEKASLTVETLVQLSAELPVLLFLDGLDEVGATEDRDRLIECAHALLTLLKRQSARVKVLATTRPQGYAGELRRLVLPLRECYLAPLAPKHALLYAQRLLEAKIPALDERQRLFTRLQEAAVEPTVMRLMSTPLQVTILAALVKQGRAPAERWKLFHSYFDFMYRREIERESYASALLAEHRGHVEALHKRVALLLQVESESAEGSSLNMDRKRLSKVVEHILKEDGYGLQACEALGGRLLDIAERRLVFLVEPVPGAFGFEIRSLQEFFAAWALTEGHEAVMKARVYRLGPVPLFRNVLLLMASRWYSERSGLRLLMTETLCHHLDEHPHDQNLRVTRAGAVLALELLEEGSARNQPKHAQALMRQATGLLDLPGSSLQVRLASVADEHTLPVLREALETRLSAGQVTWADAGAWPCLLVLHHKQVSWAETWLNTGWARLQNLQALWLKMGRYDQEVIGWLYHKLVDMPEKLESLDPLQFRFWALTPAQAEPPWLLILLGVMGNLIRYQIGIWWPLDVRRRLGTELSPVELEYLKDTTPVDRLPTRWSFCYHHVLFCAEPSVEGLAKLLQVVREGLLPAQWEELAATASWPVAACLRWADSPEALDQLLPQLRAGALGDEVLWKEAQEGWKRLGPELVPLLPSQEQLPWLPELLGLAPPLLSYDSAWPLQLSKKLQRAYFEQAAALFQTTSQPKLQKFLAQVCLRLLRRLPAKPPVEPEQVLLWCLHAGVRAEALFPKPPCLTAQGWQKVLQTLREEASDAVWNWDGIDPDVLVETFVEHPDLPWLRRALIEYRLWDVDASILLRPQLESVLRRQSPSSPTEAAELALLRVQCGFYSAEELQALLHDIQQGSSYIAQFWSRWVWALSRDTLQRGDWEALLLAAEKHLPPHEDVRAELIEELRRAQRTRKTGLADVGAWREAELPEPSPLKRPLDRVGGPIPAEPVVLTELRLENVRGIKALTFSFEPPSIPGQGQWILILGPNGVGKTTLLKALVMSLRNLANPALWPEGTFRDPWPLQGQEEARITLQFSAGLQQHTHLRGNGAEYKQEPPFFQARRFPLFAYGCRRGSALGGVARELNLSEDGGPEVATLFSEGAPLVHAETWLKDLALEKVQQHDPDSIYDRVMEALRQLLDVPEIEILKGRVMITEKTGVKLPLTALSDGYLTISGWFIDLLARWIELLRTAKLPVPKQFMQEMRGLVLLDELDLHLHPQWQMSVLERIRSLLPQMSFMATTHNPLTLVGARPKEIWMLSRERDANSQHEGPIKAVCGVEVPKLLTGGQLYTRYFGIQDIMPHKLGQSLERYGFLSRFSRRSDQEQQELESLRAYLKQEGITPDWEEVPRITTSTLPLPVRKTASSEGSRPTSEPKK